MNFQGWILTDTGKADPEGPLKSGVGFGYTQLTFKAGSDDASAAPVIFPYASGWRIERDDNQC
jgi:hypothetical protein